jgi:hypothetical protein
MFNAILKVGHQTAGRFPVSWPFPYTLTGTKDGSDCTFFWTGNSDESGNPIYSDIEEKVKW